MFKKLANKVRNFRRKVSTQVILPELDRTIYKLIDFDQVNLNGLLATDPQQRHQIEAAKKQLEELRNILAKLRKGLYTPDEEAALFEKVSEDWKNCKIITSRRSSTFFF